MQTRGAMGETMSLMITELPPGLKTTPHHHHQEQMMLGLAGGMHYLMGDTPYPLPRLTAAIALPNVRHGNINETAEQATCQRAIGREMLVIVSPAARSTRLASVKVASGLVAVYESIVR